METNVSMVATSTPPALTTEIGATPPVTPSTTEYVVAKGDSFSTIAKKFGVSVRAIQDANPNVVPTKLQIGQKLQIPAATAPATTTTATTAAPVTSAGETVYVVKSGDTLTRIAKIHNTTVKAIRSANNLKTDSIKVGQKLTIPGAAPAPVPDASLVPAPAGTVPAQ
jgi:LysM repeat protein